jgi:hypothetical protein
MTTIVLLTVVVFLASLAAAQYGYYGSYNYGYPSQGYYGSYYQQYSYDQYNNYYGYGYSPYGYSSGNNAYNNYYNYYNSGYATSPSQPKPNRRGDGGRHPGGSYIGAPGARLWLTCNGQGCPVRGR